MLLSPVVFQTKVGGKLKQGWLQPTAVKYVCMGMECAVNDTPRMATPSPGGWWGGGGEVSNLSKPLGNQDESLTTKKKKNPYQHKHKNLTVNIWKEL